MIPRLLIVTVCFFCMDSLLLSVPSVAADDDPPFEEVSVYVNVQGIGSTSFDIIIKNEQAYISVNQLFDFLKIKNQATDQFNLVSGFYVTQQNEYAIDKAKNHISLGRKMFAMGNDDLIRTSTGLYLRSKIYSNVFGIDCVFDFRSLSIAITTKIDLPVFKEQRIARMHQNIKKLNREIIADTIINGGHRKLNIGAVDWSVLSATSNKQVNSLLNMRIGAVIAGGETNVGLSYLTGKSFSLSAQNYLWRHVDNDNQFLKQLSLGKIPTPSIASLVAPVIGLQLTNAGTTFRKSMGSYTLSDMTQPDWSVELYVNNVLIDYVKADASGFFSFQVPMVYGSSVVQLRFFGPWGEEASKEQIVSIPYSFLPRNQAEYTLSNGILEDGKQSRFSHTEFKYGLSNRVTIGSGLEYLSSLTSGAVIPFVNMSYRVSSNIFLSGEYAYDVNAKAIASFKMPAELLLEYSYVSYKEGQRAVLTNALEEQKLMISKQFKAHQVSMYSRFSVNKYLYHSSEQTSTDLLLSCNWRGLSSNVVTYAVFVNKDRPNVYSNLSLSFVLPFKWSVRPQAQYVYNEQRITSGRVALEKQLFGNGFLNLAFDQNFINKMCSATVGFRFDLSFARVSFSAIKSTNGMSFAQSVNGGILYDRKAKYLKTNNRTNVGRAGLLIYPYLDLNNNNRRDNDEPKLAGLQLKINGGRIENSPGDTTVRVFDLEPFTSYLLELNPASFDHIAWQVKYLTLKVVADPNQLKLIEIPVQVKGEVSGTVYRAGVDSVGIGRIKVNIYLNDKTLAGQVLTESDGYFNFMGLLPGNYTISPDKEQLEKLFLKGTPVFRTFKIKPTIEGDIVEGVDFKLISQAKDKK